MGDDKQHGDPAADSNAAILAMQKAVADVVGLAFIEEPARLPVSIRKLCKACGVSITWKPSRISRRGSYYSSTTRPRTVGVHGKVLLNRNPPEISISRDVHLELAREVGAHELAHWLIHRAESRLGLASLQLPGSAVEEALADYAGRLFLLPSQVLHPDEADNLAAFLMSVASAGKVTLLSAATRLGDPDLDDPVSQSLRAVILWGQLNLVGEDPAHLLSPIWFVSRGEFIPVRRCHSGTGTLVSTLAEFGGAQFPTQGKQVEAVSIGRLTGEMEVHACAWGVKGRGTRMVLSVFKDPEVGSDSIS